MKKFMILVLFTIGLGVSFNGCSNQANVTHQGVKQNGMEEICNSDNIGCTGVGLMYYEGKEVKQDYFKASKYLQKSCDKELSLGCLILGGMYFKGQGVKQNDVKAAESYKKACNGRYNGGCNKLGIMYYLGRGVKQNIFKASKIFKKACDSGDKDGCKSYYSIINEVKKRR